MEDFLNQDRIYLGWAKKISEFAPNYILINEIFKTFTDKQTKPATIINTKAKSAEMCKYMGNCFLATKISLFNEFYKICEATKIDFKEAAELTAQDSRIGSYGTKVPGDDGKFGWSLSCFPKDLSALIAFSREQDVDPLILETIWTANLLHRKDHDWERLAQYNGKYKK